MGEAARDACGGSANGIVDSYGRFIDERSEKAVHARELGLTVFIDDRLDVLQHLRGIVPHLIWFGESTVKAPGWVVPARDWATVRTLLLG